MGILRLHVVEPVAPKLSLPTLDLEGIPLPRWFSEASNGKLDLRVKRHVVSFEPRGCTSSRLHDVAMQVLPADPTRPTDDIALIFAKSWVASDVQLFGLMFDFDGEEPALGSTMTSRGIPRQACAVFLDAFGASEAAKVVHTALHELGHVFNLQHDPDQASFMGDEVFVSGFSGADGQRLSEAAEKHWDFAPGGANFSFQSGPMRASGARAADGLGLEVRPDRRRYLIGEPIVLDTALKAVGGRRIRVPNDLDPGYATLRIWYENPLGEIRLYRSRSVFCRTAAVHRELSRGISLRNNPKVSLGRSGPTMLIPGSYKIWAEFGGVPGRFARIVRAQARRFTVYAPRNKDEFEISRVLRLPGVAACIVDKGGRLRWRERRLLERLIHRYPRHSALQYARYALATHYYRSRRPRHAARLLHGLSLPSGLAREGVKDLRTILRERGYV